MSTVAADTVAPAVRRRQARGGGPLLRLVGKRLLILPIALVAIATLTFILIQLMPGDPAVAIAGDFASPQQLQQIRSQLGLDQPFVERYVTHVAHAATFDLGESFLTQQSVLDELRRRLPYTVELVVLSLVVAGALGLALGTVGAYYARRPADKASRLITTVIQSAPDFLLALLLIYFLFYLAGIAPPPVGRAALTGTSAPEVTGSLVIDAALTGSPSAVWDAARQLMLPVLALGIVYAAYFAKVTRVTMADALRAPQIEFARACGLSERKVLAYALGQARTPILTYVAILFGALLGGAAIVERIFAWQGVGHWGLEAVLKLDTPVISGFVLVAGLLTILVYLALDVVVMLLDPRISYE